MATKAAPAPVATKEEAAPAPELHRIRITLTSKNVKALEKGELGTRPNGKACLLQWWEMPLFSLLTGVSRSSESGH